MATPPNNIYQEFPSNKVRRDNVVLSPQGPGQTPSVTGKVLPLLAAFALGMVVMFVITRFTPDLFRGKARPSSTTAGGGSPSAAGEMPSTQIEPPASTTTIADPTASAAAATPWASASGADPMTPQQIADKAKPSVVYIETVSMSGESRSQGSGFCVAPGMFVTNNHVVQNAKSIGARLVSGQAGLDTAVVLATDSEHDLALLRIQSLDAPVLPLQSTLPGVGDAIYTMSNPRGLEGTFTEGNVSAYRKTEKSNDPLMQITAPISPGSSGGPVLDRYGQVVAVVVAMWKDAQNINFAVPAKHIQALMSGSGSSSSSAGGAAAQPSQQQVTLTPQELYYKGLQYLDAGNKKAALEVWNELSKVDKGLADRLMEAYQKAS